MHGHQFIQIHSNHTFAHDSLTWTTPFVHVILLAKPQICCGDLRSGVSRRFNSLSQEQLRGDASAFSGAAPIDMLGVSFFVQSICILLYFRIENTLLFGLC